MTGAKSTRATEIPLYLVPQAVTRLIRARGEKVYRISVVRTHYHHYNVSVRTRLLPKELRPVREPVPVVTDEAEGLA
ncbi:MAG: hypothetical protein OS112_03795 [Methanoregula sp.]|nr:MAG: hypothetical protein OS112_03795 [Methanoregula sp.]